MNDDFEITEDELLKLKEYEDKIDNIYIKIKNRIKPLLYSKPEFYTYITNIKLLSNNIVEMRITEGYKCLNSSLHFEIPLSALKNDQTFDKWMKERIK